MISKLLFFFFLEVHSVPSKLQLSSRTNQQIKEFLKLGKVIQTHYLVLKKLRQGSLEFKASLHYKANPNSRVTGL